MKHAAKRLLSACLALLLVVGLVPAALAAEPGVLTDPPPTEMPWRWARPSGWPPRFSPTIPEIR